MMKVKKVQPFHDLVLVELPKTTAARKAPKPGDRRRPRRTDQILTVVAVGKGVSRDCEMGTALPLKKGDRVLVSRWTRQSDVTLEIDGKPHALIDGRDVLAKVTE